MKSDEPDKAAQEIAGDKETKDQILEVEKADENPWSAISLNRTSTSISDWEALDEQAKKGCFLFRGPENWLSRITADIDKDELIPNIRQELRALFAQWLKMQNVCFLLGSGASAYITEFVGKDLFKKVMELLKDRPSEKTLQDLIAESSNPSQIDQDFEKFLTQITSWFALSSADNMWPIDKISFDIGKFNHELLGNLLIDIERALAILCNVDLETSDVEHSPHELLVTKLAARDPHQSRAKIFTTNYDTLIEQAMDKSWN